MKFYPGDLSRLWVLDPFTLHYIEVKAVNQEYTRGLSLWKHLVIKRFVREELKRNLNEDALLRAKERIQDIVAKEFRQTRKIRSRLGAARWLDMQVMSWTGAASSGSPPNAHTDEPEDEDDAAGEEPGDAEEQPQGTSATAEREEPPPIAEGASSGGPPRPAGEPVASSGTEEPRSSPDTPAIPAIGVPPPPKISGITLVSEEETAEESNPITQLPEMPAQLAQTKKKNRKRGNQESSEEKGPPSDQKESPSETTANRPRPYGISVSYARPLANEPAGGKK